VRVGEEEGEKLLELVLVANPGAGVVVPPPPGFSPAAPPPPAAVVEVRERVGERVDVGQGEGLREKVGLGQAEGEGVRETVLLVDGVER